MKPAEKFARINSNGHQQIASAILKHHQLPVSAALVKQSAEEAETSQRHGLGCKFTISSFVSKTKKAIEVTITADGYDII